MAATKIKTIAILFISVLVVMQCAKVSEGQSACADGCKPVCLKEEGSTAAGCDKACDDYCKQVSGESGGAGVHS
ncbi:hypothetical protein FH972_001673 [Carpinus fangiana]|uniref:Thionin-like protein n=1 Tax=Carpinus fangiana TaxID=176857 RepID=A0A5N6QCI3_9ROSI|nr:hypothetical protein FH972_001673 [Carpinus fangiana]